MKCFAKIFNNIKSWHWYDWLKYIQATVAFILAFICLGVAVPIGISATILCTITFFVLLISVGYLIIKDSKFAHCFVILVCIWQAYVIYFYGVFRDFPNLTDIFTLCVLTVSVVCLIHLMINKKIKSVKNTVAVISYIILGYWTLIIGAEIIIFDSEPDIKFVIQKECIETKIAKGYPKEFAREYCAGPGYGCVEKFYDKNCEADIKCCFATIAEDKKWNYLDYDEHGNKIIVNQ